MRSKSNSRKPAPNVADTRPTALGTGLIALDVILSADPQRAPVLAAGGTCGNVLAALSFLGWQTFPVARLNGDTASTIVKSDLARWGVGLEYAAQEPTTATPIIVQTIRHNSQGSPTHRFSMACPECGAWLPSYRPVTNVAATAVIDAVGAKESPAPQVFFFDRVSRGAIHLATEFAARGSLVMFEPSGVGEPRLFSEALELAHVLKYSRTRLPDLARTLQASGARLLEIETAGAEGLRYRSRLLPSLAWQALEAIPAPTLIDTAGAGDWCTAGLLLQLASRGATGLRRATPAKIRDGIRFGQAAAAVACGYEGARGVMFAISEATFSDAIARLVSGKNSMPTDPRGVPHGRERRRTSRERRIVQSSRQDPTVCLRGAHGSPMCTLHVPEHAPGI